MGEEWFVSAHNLRGYTSQRERQGRLRIATTVRKQRAMAASPRPASSFLFIPGPQPVVLPAVNTDLLTSLSHLDNPSQVYLENDCTVV